MTLIQNANQKRLQVEEQLLRNVKTPRLLNAVRESVKACRSNPSLFVPPLVTFVAVTLRSYIASQIGSQAISTWIAVDAILLPLLDFVVASVLFIVTLGQAAMTGKVVSEGRTRLADWAKGARKYFFTVLGVEVVFFFLVGMPLGLINYLLVFFKMIDLADIYNLSSSLILALEKVPYGIAFGFYYLWLASAILDGKDVGASLIFGVKAARRNGDVFTGFVLLYFIVSVGELVIGYSHDLPMIGSFSMAGIVIRLIDWLSSPFWFLYAFLMYRQNPTLSDNGES